MTPAGKVGINEVALGLNLPSSALELVRLACGDRGLAEAALTGQLYEGAERVRVGFATEIVAPDSLDRRAVEVANGFARHDRGALVLLRTQIRTEAVARASSNSVRDSAAFIERWYTPTTQAQLTGLVAKLAR